MENDSLNHSRDDHCNEYTAQQSCCCAEKQSSSAERPAAFRHQIVIIIVTLIKRKMELRAQIGADAETAQQSGSPVWFPLFRGRGFGRGGFRPDFYEKRIEFIGSFA